MYPSIIWSDINRYSQTGYSAPTIFPQSENYTDKQLWFEDYAKAIFREQSHQEWLEDERLEYRMEEAMLRAEAKAEREEWE